MDYLNSIATKIKARRPVIGSYVSFADIAISELMGFAGFDFVWIGTEHTPIDKREVQNHLIAAHSAGVAAFVRVPWNEPVMVKPIIDMGPDGIVFPFIRTVEDAQKAVSSCCYPPKGERGFGPIRAIRYGFKDVPKYIETSEQQVWKILQVEHIDCVENIDSILQVEGVDSMLIGPNDLSGSIGLLGKTDHPKVVELYDTIAKACLKYGKPFGVATGFDPDTIRQWIRRGVSWMCISADFAMLSSAAGNIVKQTTNIFKAGA